MALRPLIIDTVAKTKITRAIAYADDHYYHPGADPTPGDNPDFVTMLDTYRCVFTYTVEKRRIYRHLSISVPAKDKYPHPAAAFMIAKEFGFTGWDEKTLHQLPEGWFGSTNQNEHCITLAQEVKKT